MTGLGRSTAQAKESTRPATLEEAKARWRLTRAEEAIVSAAARMLGDMQGWQAERKSMKGRKLKKGQRRRTCPMPVPADHIAQNVPNWRDRIRLMHATVDFARLRGWFVSNAYNKPDWRRELQRRKSA